MMTIYIGRPRAIELKCKCLSPSKQVFSNIMVTTYYIGSDYAHCCFVLLISDGSIRLFCIISPRGYYAPNSQFFGIAMVA